MVALAPGQCRGDKEAAHFVASVVKDQRAPVLVEALTRVSMLVERGAVELGQGKTVGWKVSRHPVHDYTDLILMENIDQIHEVLRRAEAVGRRKEAGDLIAP